MNFNALKIITGTAYREQAEAVASALDLKMSDASVVKFLNGETSVQLKETVRGADVFIIQSGTGMVNDACMELFILASAIKGASARRVTAVMPYFPYSKQSKSKAKKRGGIPAQLVARLLHVAGVDHVITLDLHYMQMMGFFAMPVDNVKVSPLLIDYVRLNVPDYQKLVVVAKNAGASKKAALIATKLGVRMAVIHGEHEAFADVLSEERIDDFVGQEAELDDEMQDEAELTGFQLIGNVKGQCVLIADELINTADSFLAAAKISRDNGAIGVILLATHGLFAGRAPEIFQESALIDSIIVTNTCELKSALSRCNKIKVIDCSPVVAEAIRRVHNHESLAALYHK